MSYQNIVCSSNSQKLQTRIIPPKIQKKHNFGAVDYFSGNLRFGREYLYRYTKFWLKI